MTVAALVVSRNRLDLLRRCLRGLQQQTFPLDEILVIDNASSDGSPDIVQTEFPSVTMIRLTENIGGAGAFAIGIDYLMRKDYDYAWLMDDDAEPLENALFPLIEAMKASTIRPGFVASTVVDFAGQIMRSHKCLEIPATENRGAEATSNSYPAAYSTFVGCLVNLEVASQTFLPVSDFFIWWDDTEYTSRLQDQSGGLCCRNSIVRHPNKFDAAPLEERLYYDLRNRLWVWKQHELGSRYARIKARQYIFWRLRTEATRSPNKLRYLRFVVSGLWSGLSRSPKLQRPGATAIQDEEPRRRDRS